VLQNRDKDEIANQEEETKKKREEVLYLLERGHNICIVGEGSKISWLKETAQEYPNTMVIRIDGFD
jgi:hypothetical protein